VYQDITTSNVPQNNVGRNVVEFAAKGVLQSAGWCPGTSAEIIKRVIKIEVKNERGKS